MAKKSSGNRPTFTDQEALLFHSQGRPGKLEVIATKPMATQRDLSLAYSPGVAVPFKRFADIDSIDLEVNTEDPDEFINCVKFLGKGWGGINLEDIKAPECFVIEQRLQEMLDVPVFHDDQHGTAIIAAAGLINALDLTGRDIKKT